MHNTLSPASLPPALAARLSLYGVRRKARLAHTPFNSIVRFRLAKAVDTEVQDAVWTFHEQPNPVARLQAELAFWIDVYQKGWDPDPDVAPLESEWMRNSQAAFKQASVLLNQGAHAEACVVLADVARDLTKYGPTPDPLTLTGAKWLDLPPEILPPGHTFLDEQP
jgi:hypothetical protein